MSEKALNEHHYGVFGKSTKRGWVLVATAVAAAFAVYWLLPYKDSTPNGVIINKGMALLTFVAVLWLTEAVHITVTALLVPVLAMLIGMPMKDPKTGEMVAMSMEKAMSGFSDPIIFLFFGGFALATALHIQKIDQKIATWLVGLAGGHMGRAVVMLCVVTALLSMWISNTATAAMMLPLALGVFSSLDPEKDRPTFVFVLLGIAYSASIGGLGTVVGSPPNGIAARALKLDFYGWMKIGLPMMLCIFPLMLIVLYWTLKPKLNRKVELSLEPIPWNPTRVATMALFVATALCWMFSKKIGLALGVKSPDSWIALVAAASIVILGLATWKEIAVNTDWGVLLLFGGGLTLSAILSDSQVFKYVGQDVAGLIGSAPPIVIIAVLAVFIILLTEFTSNTASAALLVPVFAQIAPALRMPPEALVLLIGIGSSCAFMLPVATPPNAVVFGTGLIKQSEMMKAGVGLGLMCVALLVAMGMILLA